jgi:hypothetical protein
MRVEPWAEEWVHDDVAAIAEVEEGVPERLF